MKFSGKMCFKIILKVIKNQAFTLSLEDTFFEKPQTGVKMTPPLPAILVLKLHIFLYFHTKHQVSTMILIRIRQREGSICIQNKRQKRLPRLRLKVVCNNFN